MNYYLLFGGKIAVLLIFALACLRLFVLLAKCGKRCLPVDIWRAIKPISLRGNLRLLVPVLAFAGLLYMVFYGEGQLNATRNIALTYPTASAGLNPNGSRYNMSDIIRDEILAAAIADGGLEGITVTDLKKGLTVEPVSSGETVDTLISTQFALSFSGHAKTGDLTGERVVSAVAEAYRSWFVKQYSMNYKAFDIDFQDIDNCDYPDLKDHFKCTVMAICHYSDAYYQKDSSFLSAKTGESFGSINAKARDICETGLESLDSYILANGLSKDSAAYMSRLRYQYISQNVDYQKQLLAYDVRLQAVDKYERDMTKITYIPTYGNDNSFYMSRTKTGIDYFSREADNCSSKASGILANLLDEQYLSGQLAAGTADQGSYEKADAMIDSLKVQIVSLTETMKATVDDYMDSTTKGYLAISKPIENEGFSYAVIGAAAMLLLSILYLNRRLARLNRQAVIRKNEADR